MDNLFISRAHINRLFFISGFVFFSLVTGQAQQKEEAFAIPTTNPAAYIRQQVAATMIEVQYHRPSVRGRSIFGELVPYDQVWRTGSDAATKISFSTEVIIDQQVVPEGEYELFSIPGKKSWTIILQSRQNQWGSYRYDSKNDVARFTVPSQKNGERVESFTIGFKEAENDRVVLYISWDHTSVSLPIGVDLRKTVVPQLEQALTGEGRRPYFHAAMFYYENDVDIERAAELMQLALADNPNHLGMLYRMALILERKGDIAGAIEAAKRSLAEADRAGEELRREYTRLNEVLLNRLKGR